MVLSHSIEYTNPRVLPGKRNAAAGIQPTIFSQEFNVSNHNAIEQQHSTSERRCAEQLTRIGFRRWPRRGARVRKLVS